MPTGLTKFHGLDSVRLQTMDGGIIVVTTYGAHLVSWVPAGDDERIFLSSKSPMDKRAPIRGGVPVVFPQFATYGPLPHHGLVRTRDWSISELHVGGDEGHVTLHTEDSSETGQIWPHPFRCELTITMKGAQLTLQLRIENPGAAPFTFRAALHTYLRVADIRSARLEGLHTSRYRDRTNDDDQLEDAGEALTINGEVDRVYVDAPRSLVLREPGRTLIINKDGFPDYVVWNPGKAKCSTLADMGSDAYRHMLCVEAAAIGRPVMLAPGKHWVGSQTLAAAT
jgi:glucose-6-phosphate 1-epimerase